MKTQIQIQKLLRSRFLEAKSKNPSFSLRSFANRLGISPGTLSEVLAGKRSLSAQSTSRVLTRMTCDADLRAQIMSGFTSKKQKNDEDSTAMQLTADQFKIISDWVHFGILGLLSTGLTTSQPEAYGHRLGVSSSIAADSIQRLIRLGLIEKSESGTLVRTFKRLQTTDDIATESIRAAHFQDLDLERKALEELDVLTRDFTAITIPMHPALLEGLKLKCRTFQDDVLNWVEMESNEKGIPKTEVYKFCMRTFPITKIFRQTTKPENKTKLKPTQKENQL